MTRGTHAVTARLISFVLAAVALVVLSPLILLVAASVALFMGRPVLFAQLRPGLHGAPFRLLKVRTMRDAYDPSGEPLPDAERLTALGSFLRSTSLDELPQLWNVLVGDMNIVGPRPLLMEYLPLYSAEQARRHDVRPGITGWAQINGRNAISWEERLSLDVWYVDHRSLALDLRIIQQTARKVLQRSGVRSPGEATMSRFTGSQERSA